MREGEKFSKTGHKWIQPPPNANIQAPFLRAKPLRPVGDDKVEYEAMTDRGTLTLEVSNASAYYMSNGGFFDDMCKMDILNEPEVLNNLVQRYKKDQIFTFIGPTLIIINPYRLLSQYFGNEATLRIRDQIMDGKTAQEPPHIYLIAGNAFKSMIDQSKRQAIVISGESGAGKTQSTKYCLQLLTSLSHKSKHQTEAKILACNPLLEAFGNCKTVRNDNSSRFGKYMQIYFSRENTITGASINSYLLEKSRVVSVNENERSFHIFYALIASKKLNLQQPSQYNYLKRSGCFVVQSINDAKNFVSIQESMANIGFTEQEQERIWQLTACILELGNVEFDDTVHQENEQKPCQIMNEDAMKSAACRLGVQLAEFRTILLFEKKKFLKEFNLSPYSKKRCLNNLNTMSKAIYNAIFEFILYKTQISLQPISNQQHNTISILDIFGFENFEKNSFEQLCINFTNEKLLKLYNEYVFVREITVLKEDGLEAQIENIKAPTNDHIIQTLSGKFSLFSVINDNTVIQQFRDEHIMETLTSKFKQSAVLKLQPVDRSSFSVCHSQCNVKYDVEGFKDKNEDKVLQETSDIVSNLFEHDSKSQKGKTLLNKFSNDIEELIAELTSSNAHFIRCIKPNENKSPSCADEAYILRQVRYLGVFETIQIRKKTFPARYMYQEFTERFGMLHPGLTGSHKVQTEKILKKLSTGRYLLGTKRVYMNPELEQRISQEIHKLMKAKLSSAKMIWKSYKKYRFRKDLDRNLKKLVKRIQLWKKLARNWLHKLQKQGFAALRERDQLLRDLEEQRLKKQREQEECLRKLEEKKSKMSKFTKKGASLEKIAIKMCKFESFEKIKLYSSQTVTKQGVPKLQQPKNDKQTSNSQSTDTQKQKHKRYPKKEEEGVEKVDEAVHFASLKKQNEGPSLTLDESALNESSYVEDSSRVYQKKLQPKEQAKEYQFNQSFLEEKSMLMANSQDVLFPGYISVSLSKYPSSKGYRIRKFLEEGNIEMPQKLYDHFSPQSEDTLFDMSKAPKEWVEKIKNFDDKAFFEEVLRKRKNFFGIQKGINEVMTAKTKVLRKSLTHLSKEDEASALHAFKKVLEIGDTVQMDRVFIFIEDLMTICQKTSKETKNEIFLQILKQSNSDRELMCVRMLQIMVVYIHTYSPDDNYVMSALKFYYQKLNDRKYPPKQYEYAKYLFFRLIRKLQRDIDVNYMPIKYQMMALMCRRQISVHIHLSVGTSISLTVESYETYMDIKERVHEEFSIDPRLKPQLFTFFEIINFENEDIEECPVYENQLIWDTIAYWDNARYKYSKTKASPTFYLMYKIRYTIECERDDQDVIELLFYQCCYDYFIGRIRFSIEEMLRTAACLKYIKLNRIQVFNPKGYLPLWCVITREPEEVEKHLDSFVKEMEKENLSMMEAKYLFISYCSKSSLVMCMSIPTDQNFRVFFRPKMIMLVEDGAILEEIPIKLINKFAEDEEKFIFKVRDQKRNREIYTEHAHLCCTYLSILPKLVSRK